MENLEKQLDKQDDVIRNYLLDWLDETAAEEIDEKIITEPEFFDSVLLIEQELLEDLIAGRLSGKEKARAEQIYQLPINREKLDFATALYKVAKNHHRNERSVFSKEQLSPTNEPLLQKTFLNWINWRHLIPVTAGFVLIIGISLFIWHLFPDKRGVFERELARLNQEETIQLSSEKLREITLQDDSFRTVTLMPKIQISGVDGEVIRFQLGLVNSSFESYEAIFFDDQGNELFSVSDLKSQRKEDGTYIQVLVPSEFLPPGDFQINLQGKSSAGTLTKAGSFTFRIIQQ